MNMDRFPPNFFDFLQLSHRFSQFFIHHQRLINLLKSRLTQILITMCVTLTEFALNIENQHVLVRCQTVSGSQQNVPL